MHREAACYLNLPLGISTDEVRRLLGEPALVTPRHGDQQWVYEEGRFVLTFAGSGPWLIRIARRPENEKEVNP